MTIKNSRKLDALRSCNEAITGVFRSSGCELVEPDIIQPAGPFLDRLGENIRSRTYVFTDPDGAELCLRPDLTIPVSLIYLKREPECKAPRRFCYSGPAFRFQPGSADAGHPREFAQAGIEIFADKNRLEVEAETAGLAMRALQKAGLASARLVIGDLGLFSSLLAAIEMPERWRRRLSHQFWRHDAFHALLTSLGNDSAERAEGREKELLASINQENAAERVAMALDNKGIPLFGGRSTEEIAARLLEHAADRAADPLNKDSIRLIEDYLKISASPRRALDAIARLTKSCPINLDDFSNRLDLLEEQGFDLDAASFSAGFGRDFEYYTGFVFQLGVKDPLAGGGRYDDLLEALGAPGPVPAMGAAIHTERLLMELGA